MLPEEKSEFSHSVVSVKINIEIYVLRAWSDPLKVIYIDL